MEKLRSWSQDPAAAFSFDELLTWVSTYWISRSIGTSFASFAVPVAMQDLLRASALQASRPLPR